MKAGCYAGAMHACKGWEASASAKKHSGVLSNFGGAERGKLGKQAKVVVKIWKFKT